MKDGRKKRIINNMQYINKKLIIKINRRRRIKNGRQKAK
jgi:hypothetical protein